METAPDPNPDSNRITSVDALRGLVITLMVFVNDMGETPQAPTLLKHVGVQADSMRLPDLVFPAFLFLAGVSVPLSFSRLFAQGKSRLDVLRKVLARTGALLVMGVVMVNMEEHEPWARGLWGALAYACMALAFAVVPRNAGPARTLLKAGRSVGAGLLLALVLAYRTADGKALFLGPLFTPGDTVWLRHSWWGILGLIAWAYLASSVVYLVLGKRREWLVGATGWLLLLFVAAKSDLPGLLASRTWLDWARPAVDALVSALGWVNGQVGIGGDLGSQASISVAGCCLGSILVSGSEVEKGYPRVRWALTFAAGLFLLGLVLDAPDGINKIRGTPSWCMYCSAITAAAWALLYYLMDMRGKGRWSRIVQPAGANPLLAYLLHPFLYMLVGLAGERAVAAVFFHHSLPASATVLGSLVMAIAVVQATGWIARSGYRLKV